MTARRFAHPSVDAFWRLDPSTYARIRDQVLPTADELRWCEIPWRASLVDALADARDADMPVLLWAMDGHPLASTCSNGIITRRTLWPDEDVRALAERFVPAADDAGALRRGAVRGAAAFRHIAEQGHFGGRSEPTDTRQGVYAVTPGGTLLASVTSNNPRRVAEALRHALARWDALAPDERIPGDAAEHGGETTGDADRIAAGDLVLHVFSRDLPRPDRETGAGDRAEAFPETASPRSWNLDVVRFSAVEALGFMPDPAPGARRVVAPATVLRIAQQHLVDNVRGQTVPFARAAIAEAALEAEVTAVDGAGVTVRLTGAMRASERGRWPIRGFADRDAPAEQERGYAMTLLGHAVFDAAAGRVREFELVAAGPRWGATQYNERADDLAPAPMGVVLTLAADAQRAVPAPQRSANAARS